ncbi:hypothetical protein ACI3LY_004771 [Candidozyma auris]|uniref:Uncharacterized protein n=2 Tax=Candidozyma auris TaxID=498019 RepID=A0A2H0ZDW9_CANAR|nr:hypothetical protein B9J08_005502 [[Candida] auris]QWW24467.1 hypothetical protein CA7LBN_003324 [[Candida] auris]
MKKKAPKLSKKAFGAIGQSKTKVSETTEDFMDDGAIEEESGDRWLGSDLAKALRFYQKAYISYKSAVATPTSDRALLLDAHYNAARLLFHVFIQYSKTDGIDVHKLTNVCEVLTGDDNSVVQNISTIVEAHERALQVEPANPPLDLQYNAALVYTEAIEEADDVNEDLLLKAISLFQEVLRRQVMEFQDFLQFMLEPERPTSSEVPSEDQQYSSSKTTQPPDIIETIISAYGLVQAILESVTSAPGQLEYVISLVTPFVQALEEVASETTEKYNEQNNHQEFVAPLQLDQIHEYLVVKTTCQALSTNSYKDACSAFEQIALNIPEWNMSAADSIDTILERHEVYQNPSKAGVAEYWDALTNMNNFLKKAQELLSAKLQETKTKNSTNTEVGLGSLIAQICKVFIARADVDLQRSQLEHDIAKVNSTVLFNNAKAFLKSAINMSKTSGGIREKVVEKAQKERRRHEASSRLCVLERDFDEEELNRTLGKGQWENDFANYRDLWYFQKFFP